MLRFYENLSHLTELVFLLMLVALLVTWQVNLSSEIASFSYLDPCHST